MNTIKSIKTLVIVMVLMLAIVAPTALMAASLELTAAAKVDFDKITAAADKVLADKINTLYNRLHALQEQDHNWDESIRLIHYNNEESLILLRKQIKEIDITKISKLEIQVKQTKERCKPVFAVYTALNQQISIAKSLKNKKLSNMLASQAAAMKIAVQLARQEIRNKEDSLKTAKELKAKTIKKIRDTLSGIDLIQVHIKAERSTANDPKEYLSIDWKNFNQAVRRGDAKRTSDSLMMLVSVSQQIIEQKQKVYSLEKKISEIILKAKLQIPTK